MADKVKKHDFVELDYTGKFSDGTIFDTTQEKVAKENNFPTNNRKFNPVTICIGENQIILGLDQEIIGKEIEEKFTTTLPAERAFGKRDIKKIKIVPMNTFNEHKVKPYPGLQIDVDGEMGLVQRVSSGRVIVNFNHPLAGKEVTYEVKILKKITDNQEKIKTMIHNVLKIQKNFINVELKEEAATVFLPMALPPQFVQALKDKIIEVTDLKSLEIKKR